ncbi:hypothetical protein FNV43_RR25525 [Rhamnella rubrinervis]|uniref:RING-type domain-containing protein n=1 Tax=Rhamnella rubrinervis TaxID=2594499 RepID=A0A8K0E055_9ROSA|nr:hypothetical protein FNV43_RR25525 [Rhamnella rubrinervis]
MDSFDYKGPTGRVLMGIQISRDVLVLLVFLALAHYCIARLRLGLPPFPRPHTATGLSTATVLDRDSTSMEVGLDETALWGFPELLYSQVKLGNSVEAPSCCSICLADYRESDMLRLLPECGHLFHKKCVDPWLKLHPTCPNCRNSSTPVSTPMAELTPIAWQSH